MELLGLEYMLLFGPPENKLELLEGRTPCSFPFLDRAEADAHFAEWSRTLARWQGVSEPAPETIDDHHISRFNKFSLEQYRRPLRLEVPSILDVYHWAYTSFWDRALWPMQPAGFDAGVEFMQDHWDVKHNLWRVFEDARGEQGIPGEGIGGVDVVLTETDVVQPDHVWYCSPRSEHMIANNYYCGTPSLIMEVLSPFSRAVDRGPRMQLYCRVGVPQLWLMEPLTRTIELYLLKAGQYVLAGTAGPGQRISVPGFNGLTLNSDEVFDTQSRRHTEWHRDSSRLEPVPNWVVPRETVVGLQHLLLLGHTERRREIWRNQVPCVLAFGSSEEAHHRLEQFVDEAVRWEELQRVLPKRIEPELEVSDVGRFHFCRRGHVVHLNVEVDGRLYRKLLEINTRREAWDWGEES